MEEYADLTIIFSADGREMETLEKEGNLSREYEKIVDELRDWLEQRIKSTPFKIEVRD